MTMMMGGEREDLLKLVRQRERVLKSAARQRSAKLLADFENQMGQIYSFDQDEVWATLMEAAEREVEKCKTALAVQCPELGILDRFAPNMHLIWLRRGYDNAVEKRRQAARLCTGYLDRVLAALRSGALQPTPGVQHAMIERDASCGVYRGRECDCVPNISESGPYGVTVIDERGVGRKARRS
jgi:hypothetical protein